MRELRRDLWGRYLVMVDEGNLRANLLNVSAGPDLPELSEHCPFCPGNESHAGKALLESVDDDGNWTQRVVPGRQPLFRVEEQSSAFAMGPWDVFGVSGAQEILVDTPRHDLAPWDFDSDVWQGILRALLMRLRDLRRDRRLQCRTFVKRWGPSGCNQIHHSHTQILALGMPLPDIDVRYRSLQSYAELHGRCRLCDMLRSEREVEKRILLQTPDFIALCPYAGRSAFEVQVIPRDCRPGAEDLEFSQLWDLARVLASLLSAVERTLGRCAFELRLVQAPFRAADGGFHWLLEFVPQIVDNAGILSASGVYTNPVAPEKAAHALRNALTHQGRT